MTQRDISYYSRLWYIWAEWEFLDYQPNGIHAVWPETTIKPDYKPLRAAKRKNLCNTKGKPMKCLYRPVPSQPKSTKTQSTSKELLYKVDVTSEKIRAIAISQPKESQKILICLFSLRRTFAEITEMLGVSSREIRDAKYGVLKLTQQLA